MELRLSRAAAPPLVMAVTSLRLWAQIMGGGASGLIWPAQGEYAGSKKCAVCHRAEARNYRASSMSRALEPINDCAVLKQNPRMEWTDGEYRYLIERQGQSYLYRITDGTHTADVSLLYAFGQGSAGQTYVFEVDGDYYESRVSYYESLKGLALTVGARNTKPTNIREAEGRRMSPAEARDCFGCHTTAARRGNIMQLANYEHGVQCEACHGPGAAHIASVRDGKPKAGTIRGLKGMAAEETSDLCGSCHRTWETVMLLRLRGVNNVRFQPYRLASSRCFGSDDKRIACTACHDPHGELQRDVKAYDSKCAVCHNQQNVNIREKTCKVAKEACVSCHMPRVEIPATFHAFTDHRIRVARKNDPYPD